MEENIPRGLDKVRTGPECGFTTYAIGVCIGSFYLKSFSNRRNVRGDPAILRPVQDKYLDSRLSIVADCAWISVGAVLGCLARLHTDRFSAAFGTYGSKVSNALGCFILGLLVASDLDEEVLPHVYTGLTVGFCGSFTTYSGWNLSIVRTELPKFYPSTANLAGCLKGFSSMVFGALSALAFFCACFVAGNDSAKALRMKGVIVESPNGNERESTGASWISRRTAAGLGFGVFCSILGTLVLGHQAALYGVAPAAWLHLWKRDIVPCLLSPLGALSRFFLSRLFNKRWLKGALPAGTFAANVIGSLAMGVTYFALIGNDISDLNRTLLEGFKSGFLGGLTTMSTFAAEVVGHRGKHGLFASYGYMLLTVVSALVAVLVVSTVMQ